MRQIYLVFFFFLLIASPVFAVGISPPKVTMDFVPDQVSQFTYSIFGADYIKTYVTGELSEYATISDPDQGGGPRYITVTLDLPNNLTPGRHKMYVGALETTPGEGMVSAVTAIQAVFYVDVPYPGKYVVASVYVPDGDIDKEIPIKVTVINRGTEPLSSVSTSIEVRDDKNSLAASLSSSARPLEATQTTTFDLVLNTTGFLTGNYTAAAIVNYDGNSTTASYKFKLGSIALRITDFTRYLRPGMIYPFFVEVENLGSTLLSNIYAEVTIGGVTIKTPTSTVAPFKRANLTTYIDTNRVGNGTFNATVTVFFADNSTTETGIVSIYEPESPSQPMQLSNYYLLAGALVVVGTGFLYMSSRRRRPTQNILNS